MNKLVTFEEYIGRINEDYPQSFDMEHFKSITSSSGRVKYNTSSYFMMQYNEFLMTFFIKIKII
jgi:hypothetical protein